VKVLHLPYNVGSQISVTTRALRAIGVKARGLIARSGTDLIHSHDGLEQVPKPPPLPRSWSWARQNARRYSAVMTAIAWADILHWHYGELMLTNGRDLRWARFLGKPGLVEFWGTDIRIGEVEAADNPWFAEHAPREYRADVSREHSLAVQTPFARAGFSCIVSDAAMRRYLEPGLFPQVHLIRQRVMLEEYAPMAPSADQRRPVIIHSPSNPKLKGTEFVLAAIEALRPRFDFQFRLVHGVPRAEAMEILRGADLFIDQMIFGTHGLASLEAMAFAKPVVCYIKPSMQGQYPADLPIVNASPDNLTEVLAGLLGSAERRREIGLAGRAYVEKHHDALSIARELVGVYQATLATRRRGRHHRASDFTDAAEFR
jgi:glycosyltransferase involved in cell wall biosynthesis